MEYQNLNLFHSYDVTDVYACKDMLTFAKCACIGIQVDSVFTRDIAETPSKAYTRLETSPSPQWDMT